jgi:Ca-activated chloride channel family protein
VTARLRGTRATAPVDHVFQSEFAPKSGRYQFIPKLWAGRRIGYLLEDMRKNGETPEVKDEVVRLSKKYGIMTPYTAFLAAPEAVRLAQTDPQMSAMGRADQRNSAFFIAPPVPDAATLGNGSRQANGATAKRDISASKLLQAPSVAAFDARPEEKEGADAGVPSISAAGRQFTLIDGVWTDWSLLAMTRPPSDTISVKPFSEAYFRLNQIPGMAKLLAVGERMVFLWHSCAVKIDPSGAEKWNPEWEHLL